MDTQDKSKSFEGANIEDTLAYPNHKKSQNITLNNKSVGLTNTTLSTSKETCNITYQGQAKKLNQSTDAYEEQEDDIDEMPLKNLLYDLQDTVWNNQSELDDKFKNLTEQINTLNEITENLVQGLHMANESIKFLIETRISHAKLQKENIHCLSFVSYPTEENIPPLVPQDTHNLLSGVPFNDMNNNKLNNNSKIGHMNTNYSEPVYTDTNKTYNNKNKKPKNKQNCKQNKLSCNTEKWPRTIYETDPNYKEQWDRVRQNKIRRNRVPPPYGHPLTIIDKSKIKNNNNNNNKEKINNLDANRVRALIGLRPLPFVHCEICQASHLTKDCKVLYCKICMKTDHTKFRDCPQVQMCQICAGPGHSEKYCTSAQAILLRLKCRCCGSFGHIMQNCTRITKRQRPGLVMRRRRKYGRKRKGRNYARRRRRKY